MDANNYQFAVTAWGADYDDAMTSVSYTHLQYLSGKVQELFRICKEFYRCRSFLVSVQIIY